VNLVLADGRLGREGFVMLFQLETKNVETGLVYKSPLFASFAEARAEARAVSMAGRRTVRVVQVAPKACDHCGDEYYTEAGEVQCCGPQPEICRGCNTKFSPDYLCMCFELHAESFKLVEKGA